MWVVRVAVRDAILVETAAGMLEKVVEEATRKLKTMSQRIILAAEQNGNSDPEAASSRDGTEFRESTIPPPPRTPRVR